jgi:type III pantothenate kinase
MKSNPSLIYVLDVGNSAAKVGLWNEATQCWDYTHASIDFLTEADAESGFPLIICSVSSEVPRIVRQWKGRVLELGSKTALPFSSEYDLSQWGPDRMAAVAGAFSKKKKCNALIIDAGTCITFDYLDSNRGHYGGPIAPGLHLRAMAMHKFTGRLPLVTLENEDLSCLTTSAKNTQEALILGVFEGWKNEISERIKHFKKQNPKGIVYLTGGDAQYFEANPKNRIFAAPLLVFEGMVHLWKWNR